MSRRGQRIRDWMGGVDRSVTPVIATILIVALVIVIAASFGTVAFGFTDRLSGTSVSANGDQCLQSVDFDPNDVDGFADGATANLDCVMWFDATQENFNDGQSIDELTDRSENGFDATAVDSSEPIYQSNVQGVSAVQFNGGTDGGLSTEANTSDAGLTGDSGFTVSTVVNTDADDGAVVQFGTVDGSNPPFAYQPNLGINPNEWQVLSGYPRQYVTYNISQPDGWLVQTHVYDGNNLKVYVNGELQEVNYNIVAEPSSEEIEFSITDSKVNIGLFNFDPSNPDEQRFDGSVAELLIFDRALENTDREVLECTLDKKHGDAVTVDHC